MRIAKEITMLEVFAFQPFWNEFGLLNPSPFCTKLEVYLRLAKIPYKTHVVHNPGHAPRKKLPFIKEGGKTICDTTLIIDYLKTTYGNALDQNLSATLQAQALAVQRLLEEHLYWIIVYSRWVDPKGFARVKADFFNKLPRIVQLILPRVLQKRTEKTLWMQGIGRFSPEGIYVSGKNDVMALSELLSDKKFFFGDAPTSIDASLYAMLTAILYSPIPSPLQVSTQQLINLNAYCERMQKLIAL
jgi:glutathione S-transferase